MGQTRLRRKTRIMSNKSSGEAMVDDSRNILSIIRPARLRIPKRARLIHTITGKVALRNLRWGYFKPGHSRSREAMIQRSAGVTIRGVLEKWRTYSEIRLVSGSEISNFLPFEN